MSLTREVNTARRAVARTRAESAEITTDLFFRCGNWKIDVTLAAWLIWSKSLIRAKAFDEVLVLVYQRQDFLHFLIARHANEKHLQEKQQR